MDDSNILYYLVLGGIYIISRFLKKKKTDQAPIEQEEASPNAAPTTAKKRPTSIEDILKDLTSEFAPEEPKPAPKVPVRTIEPVYEELPDYQRDNIEAIRPGEKIDIVPHEVMTRKKIAYERTGSFTIQEEEPDVASEIRDFLEEEDGAQKAIIMKEIFDRKY